MIKKTLCFILLITTPWFPLKAQEELPFWRSKKKIFAQIKKERRVVVSVKKEAGHSQQKFRMLGVGAVNVPVTFAVGKIKDFEKLKEVSSYFKEVKHNREKQQIYLVLQALGYKARLLLKYKWKTLAGGKQQMDWKVVWGSFTGMVGHFHFDPLESGQTEVSIWALFSGKKIPLPAFFLRITLEVIAEKVAQKMRSYIEGEYQLQKSVKKR